MFFESKGGLARGHLEENSRNRQLLPRMLGGVEGEPGMP